MGKESIRKKIAEAKKSAEDLLKSRKATPETIAVIKSLLLILDIVVSVLLEKKTRKNSSNSGLPPSRNNGSNGNRNKPNSANQQKLGSQLPNSKRTTVTEELPVNECSQCFADLSRTPVINQEKRKLIDIVYEIVTTEFIADIKECYQCGSINKGAFPQGIDGQIQYGAGIKAAIINYIVTQALSLGRVQEHFMGLIGRFISQAVCLKYISQLYFALETWEKHQIQKLLTIPSFHVDETSLRVSKVNYWIHVYSTGDITLQFIHSKRGSSAVDDIGIIPKYGGIIIHDCWATYLMYKNVGHALCGAHLLRELKFIEDSNQYSWATQMKELLQNSAEIVAGRPLLGILYREEYLHLVKQYRLILKQALKEMPPFPVREDGQKGKLKHTDAQNLWIRLKKHESSVLMFARNKHVPFTNNRAERDIRVSKLKQKVSGCFRTEKYARAYCRIMSYIKTMRYRGYSSLEAISIALSGEIPL
ncbi:MAG: IS66 family transposase [Oligoflexales bacterium]|nr:IS66 family transposase [Oligoflexales bacterium]